MAVITAPTYDPQTYAEGLANDYVSSTKAILDRQSAAATATATGLTKLGSALSTFQSALAGLATGTTSVSATKASFSNTAIGTATATSAAQAGTYAFYVQQLATAGQVSYNVASSDATNAGSMDVVLMNGTTIKVDLASADGDKDGKLSAKEVAAAINAAADNKSQITASTMTINGDTRLVLTSNATGADNIVKEINTAGLGDANLQAALGTGNQTVLTAASNAIVYAGGKNGTKIEQGSNTFSVVDDVKFTITQAQGVNDAAVTLTIAADNSGTAANVQKFVDAYNALLGSIKTLTAAGDHTLTTATGSATTSADAAFYNDSGVLNLRDRLNGILRDATGGQSLISYGLIANKDGTLTLDSGRLNKAIAANPEGLDKLFGRAGIGVDSGVLGAMNKLTTLWTSSAGGLITQRKAQNDRLQSDLTDRQAVVQNQFDNAYKRYLAQFTALQTLQANMTNTSNMFTAMFTPDSDS
ncbi:MULTISPECIES: flagellar filament capping protein FliD [unclassified Duganella]|uniref:flagellar filament capping protein FliD n=1 Tax=unclassified Duganella TaxID=2636909 RepID=UPI00087FE473|nr:MULTISPECIES: flagellar filament capping protein FliD [unclassified Duganella]SDF68328.1 flagellar hook-associated protein 2 [Duganella sp. OV458]SDI60853.1 flagellar hook-associated protein 2 [Duganella sp. OV510]